MKEKKFLLAADEFQPLVKGLGSCIATDRITVDGEAVRFMYRESPDHDADSGWRFMTGLESEEYLENSDNLGIYDVNTIANYDQRIIPHLNAPTGSVFERRHGAEDFSINYDSPLPGD